MAVALLVAMVLAQALGWMHRSMHWTAASSGAPALHAGASDAAEAVHAGARSGWIADLFGSHGDASECRLFDVLGQAGCAPAASLLPVLPAASLLVATHGDFVARWAALFDARGPPASR